VIGSASNRLNVPPWVVELAVGIVIAFSALLATNALNALQAHDATLETRVNQVESQNAIQASEISQLHIQIDTVNTRGSAGADARLVALETKQAVLESRLSAVETRLGKGAV
jgi:uncharacterized coiled-coil protein SlyX